MKKFYSPSTGGFYSDEFHGKNIPKDAVSITDKEHKSLLSAESSGKIIVVGSEGQPVAIDPPETPVPDLLERVKNDLRAQRRDILDAVTGIGFRSNVTGNTELAKEAAQVSQQLLDITDDALLNEAKTYDEMRSAGLAAYRRISDSVSQGLISAFNYLEK